MNQEVKQLWVNALTSGEYQQGYHALRNGHGGFCCYGVLCDLHRKVTGKGKWDGEYYKTAGVSEAFCMGSSVARWAGLPVHGSNVRIDDGWLELASHNDSQRTFAEIAAAIQEQL